VSGFDWLSPEARKAVEEAEIRRDLRRARANAVEPVDLDPLPACPDCRRPMRLRRPKAGQRWRRLFAAPSRRCWSG